MEKKATYEIEVRELTNEYKQALDLLRRVGELGKPYDSTILGSISFHFFAEPNRMTGGGTVGFYNLATEINVKPELLNRMLEPLRDNMLKIIGGELRSLKPKTQAETEEETEKQIKAEIELSKNL